MSVGINFFYLSFLWSCQTLGAECGWDRFTVPQLLGPVLFLLFLLFDSSFASPQQLPNVHRSRLLTYSHRYLLSFHTERVVYFGTRLILVATLLDDRFDVAKNEIICLSCNEAVGFESHNIRWVWFCQKREKLRWRKMVLSMAQDWETRIKEKNGVRACQGLFWKHVRV